MPRRHFAHFWGAVTMGIPEQYRAQTRIVFTADFVRSVNDRRTDSSSE